MSSFEQILLSKLAFPNGIKIVKIDTNKKQYLILI